MTMQGATEAITNPWTLILFGAAILVFVVVALVIGSRKAQSDRYSKLLERAHPEPPAEEKAAEEIIVSAAPPEAENSIAQLREEMLMSLRGMSDSVTRAMGELARTQQVQLDAFGGSLAGTGHDEELRARIRRIEELVDSKTDSDDERLRKIGDEIAGKIGDMMASTDRRMQLIEQGVDMRIKSSLDRSLGESFQLMSDRLEQVYQGLSEMQMLATGVSDLKRVLSGVQARGTIGEIQLGALLSQVLSPEQYEKDRQIIEEGERVNFAVKLPGRMTSEPTCYLPIDARFPHRVYTALVDALEDGDPERVGAASEAMEAEIRREAEFIEAQFIAPPKTTDFAVLFLPSEGLYAEIARRAKLAEDLQRNHHVMLAGPATLTALLNSLQMGFKALVIERRSEEVWALLGAVRGEFINFADALAKTQKRIRQASESIDDAARKSRTIQRKLKSVESLDAARRRELLGADGDLEEEDFSAEMDEWD